MKKLIIILLFVSAQTFAQTTYLNPLQGVPCTEAQESYQDINEKLDSLIDLQKNPPLGELTSRASHLRWGTSTNLALISDTADLATYCNVYGTSQWHYFYTNFTQGKIPQYLVCGTQTYYYMVFDYSIFSAWFEMTASSRLRYVYARNTTSVPNTLPASWANGAVLQRIYLQSNGFNVTEVDNLITQLETLANGGMGAAISGTHYMYLNSTAATANATPTLATHVANGWVDNGTYLEKTINTRVWRVYYS